MVKWKRKGHHGFTGVNNGRYIPREPHFHPFSRLAFSRCVILVITLSRSSLTGSRKCLTEAGEGTA